MTTVPSAALYLSRLLLNPHSKQVMSELAQSYEMHRTLMRAFPAVKDASSKKAREEFGVLFRAEVDEVRNVAKVYVQSCVEPDWSFLARSSDYLCARAVASACDYKDVMPAYQKIQNGQIFAFRLRANPTKRIAKKDDPLKGKRVELQREEEQLDWLIRKGKEREKDVSGGFEILMKEVKDLQGEIRLVPRVKVCAEGRQVGRKKTDNCKYATTHFAVSFDGLLRVTDSKAFFETLTRGIGGGKAFGFGLLSISSAHSDDTDRC